MDAGLTIASGLLALFFGAALGNLLRGLPIDERGWFSLTLFTDFSAARPSGFWTGTRSTVGLFAVAALALHGAAFLVWKTGGPVHDRSRRLAMRLVVVVAAGWALVTVATVQVNATFFAGFTARPGAWPAIAAAAGGLVAVALGLRGHRPLVPFLGSCTFLAGLLAATAITIFPEMLRSIGAPGAFHHRVLRGERYDRSVDGARAGGSSGFRSPSSTSSSCFACTAASHGATRGPGLLSPRIDGRLMDDMTTRFWTDLIGRLTGPMTFRLILQPAMASLLAVRDGIKDAKAGRPAYFWAIFT